MKKSIDFIKTKGPFPLGELVLVSGNFNADALIDSSKKGSSTIYDMLQQPNVYPLLNARKSDITKQYTNMTTILTGGGSFKVIDTQLKKKATFSATYGLCEFSSGRWQPKETVLSPANDNCSNKVLDYVF